MIPKEGILMRTVVILSLINIAAVMLTSACTQQQQENLSSSKIDKDLQERISKGFNQTKQVTESTGDWLKAEGRLRKLEFEVRKADSDKKVPQQQLTGLNQSVEGIRAQLKAAIKSGQGLDSNETARILSAIDAVEHRLDGLLAGHDNKTY